MPHGSPSPTTRPDDAGILTLTLGAGKKRPHGVVRQAGDVAELAALLQGHQTPDAWWSASQFVDDHRKKDNCLSICAIAVDVDYRDADGKHAAPPDDAREQIEQVARDSGATLFHQTPRGARLVWVLREQCHDLDRWEAAARAVCAQLDDALVDTGYEVDTGASCDRAHFLWTPNTTVEGVQRAAEVEILGDAVDLDDIAPVPRPVAAPAVEPRVAERQELPSTPTAALTAVAARGPYGTMQEAVAAYRRDHPLLNVPDNTGTCPLCGHHECFGRLPGTSDRWFCFSEAHERDSGVGVPGEKGWHGDVLDLHAAEAALSRADLLRRDRYLAIEPASNSAILAVWQPLETGVLSRRPPPREYLLRWPTRDGEPALPRMGDGFAPTGVTGFLSSEGGVGKTTLLLALGVAVVTGRAWLDYHVDEARVGQRVLLALAEESLIEVQRRLYDIAEFYGLNDDERRLVEQRLIVLPLAGKPCALATLARDGSPCRTHEMSSLLRKLDGAGEPWALVVLDPLARLFPAAESENRLATFAVQLAEQLTEVPGKPLVMLAHHSSKLARREGAVDARGVTGLTDAARWALTLKSERNGTVEFLQSKSNYSAPMLDPLILHRARGGLLRVATAEEAASAETVQDRKAARKDAEMLADAARLAIILLKNPGLASRRAEELTAGATSGGMGRDRYKHARGKLGDALVEEPGKATTKLLSIDASKLTPELLAAIDDAGGRELVSADDRAAVRDAEFTSLAADARPEEDAA